MQRNNRTETSYSILTTEHCPEIARLKQESQELDTMLVRALRSADSEHKRQHLQLSRQHNKRLLDYKLALLDACQQFDIKANGVQIQYDPISQLFEVNTRHAGQRYPLERALNSKQLPILANCTRAFLEVTRALAQLEKGAVGPEPRYNGEQNDSADNLTAIVA